MNEENVLVGKVIDQSSRVIEKAYDDFVHPSAKSLGNTISLLPRTVGVWLSKWEKWVINGEESIRLTAQAVQEKTKHIPEEKLTEPEAYVAIPAVQQLSYCYDSEELRELYANLLVSSMNKDTKPYVHPSFVDIIKQLSPMDAKVIEIMRQEKTVLPVVTVKLISKKTQAFKVILGDYSIDLLPLFKDPIILSASLQNLDRLSIIQIRYDRQISPDERYNCFYEDNIYKEIVTLFAEENDSEITLLKGVIELTEFGRSFCEICCANKADISVDKNK